MKRKKKLSEARLLVSKFEDDPLEEELKKVEFEIRSTLIDNITNKSILIFIILVDFLLRCKREWKIKKMKKKLTKIGLRGVNFKDIPEFRLYVEFDIKNKLMENMINKVTLSTVFLIIQFFRFNLI